MTVVQFPPQQQRPSRPKPDRVRVEFDLGTWALAYYSGERFRSRLHFASEEAARKEARRLVQERGFSRREA